MAKKKASKKASVEARWGRGEFAVIGISILCGLAIWVIDAVLECLIFDKGETFLHLLITDTPKEDVYDRLVVLAAFTAFGIIMSRVLSKRRHVEKDRERDLHVMGERVKELSCMYGVGNSIRERETLDEVFLDVAGLIPPGWHYPEVTRGKVVFDGVEYTLEPFEETEWKQSSDIIVDGRKRGVIEVYYLDECPVLDEGPFLKEERDLINGIANALSEAVERQEGEAEIGWLAMFPAENPNPVLRVSKDGMILYRNDSSRPILELWGCEDGEALSGGWRQMLSEALNKGEAQETEAEWGGKIYSLTFAPVRNSDFVNVYGLDITEREKAEEEKRKVQTELFEQHRDEKEHVEAEVAKLREELVRKTRLAAIGQVSASIAHDLRNPLGSVRNASYFLRRHVNKDEPKLAEYTQIIDEEVARADRIITNLLEMARPKAPHKEKVDLGGIIKEVFSRAKGASGVHCEVSMAPDPFAVQADPSQLRQVVANIVENSIEAMKGGGDFFVEACRDAGYDTIVFRDTGPGFAPDVMDAVFEPLITTKASGTGLGLTICSGIIENHGGSIAVEECEEGGAAIRIRLPRE